MDAMVLSEERTLERFNRHQDRIARDMGYGSTAGAVGLTHNYVERFAAHIRVAIEASLKSAAPHDPDKALARVIRYLSPEVIAVVGLRYLLHAIAVGANHREACQQLGSGLAGECWAAGLLLSAEKMAKRSHKAAKAAEVVERIEKAAKARGNLKARKARAEKIAAKMGYMAERWVRADLIHAGNWLMDQALTALPIFTTFEATPEGTKFPVLYPTITEEALAEAEAAVEESLRRHPVFMPCTQEPQPWTAIDSGGYWDKNTRLRANLVRTYHKDTRREVAASLKDGTLQPTLDAVNRLQNVAWTVNKPVLDVMVWCQENGVEIEGVPSCEPLDMPPAPEDVDTNESARKLWRYRMSMTKQKNRSRIGDRILFTEDTKTAALLSEHERFYCPMNMDWRGRVYAVPHFNFQRDDRVRALFLFADGAPIGREGLDWLKIHTANCGAFEGVDKKPMQHRIAWATQNMPLIQAVAADPKGTVGHWSQADKPFLYLAACKELSAAIATGPGYVTTLPVSWDGSCSGLQHLCAMTRAPEGHLVNLTPNDRPNDVYAVVAKSVCDRVSADLSSDEVFTSREGAEERKTPVRDLARRCLEYGINRRLVKRNVMTYSYSSKRFGMAKQHQADLMRPLSFEVLEGTYDEHPFGPDNGIAASRYLANHTYAAIEEVVNLPAQAMAFLQQCASVLAEENKPLRWVTPTGLPWVNRYHASQYTTIKLWLQEARIDMRVGDGHEPELTTHRAVNGVAPNFVHALDAAHLMMVVNASHQEGIRNVATVHDSFGCLAPQAARFNAIIREQFVRLYTEHDVLAEILEAAKRDLPLHKQQSLPAIPTYGPLQLTEVLSARYCFA